MPLRLKFVGGEGCSIEMLHMNLCTQQTAKGSNLQQINL